MRFFQKYFFEIKALAVLIVLYFFSRLYNIMSLPLFTDEAIYTRWSQIARWDANWRFISLTDGKQPSFVWIDMTLMRFISDPLLAGRLVSVIAGFFSMIGLYFVASELFGNRKIGIVAAFLYVIYPFALVYDRMALYDSLVGAFMVWAFYFSIILVRRVRFDIALILGMVIGGGALTKSNTFFSIPLLLPTLLLFDFRQKGWRPQLVKWVFFSIISAFLGFLIYSILRLSPFFHIINEKNEIFIYPFREWIFHPFEFFVGNLRGLFDWLSNYISWPFIFLIFCSFLLDYRTSSQDFIRIFKNFLPVIVIGILVLTGLYFGGYPKSVPEALPFVSAAIILYSLVLSHIHRRQDYFQKILLLIWFLVPFVYLSFFGKTLYPRLIFNTSLFLLPLISYSLFRFCEVAKKPFWIGVILLLFFFVPLRADYYILNDFARAPIPTSDLEQYVNGWSAGGGVAESVDFFKQEASKGPIFIATEGTFGLMPYAYEIYLIGNPNITIKGFWPVQDMIPAEFLEASKKMPVYVVFYQPCPSCLTNGSSPVSWPLNHVVSYKKGIRDNTLSVYKIRAL